MKKRRKKGHFGQHITTFRDDPINDCNKRQVLRYKLSVYLPVLRLLLHCRTARYEGNRTKQHYRLVSI